MDTEQSERSVIIRTVDLLIILVAGLALCGAVLGALMWSAK